MTQLEHSREEFKAHTEQQTDQIAIQQELVAMQQQDVHSQLLALEQKEAEMHASAATAADQSSQHPNSRDDDSGENIDQYAPVSNPVILHDAYPGEKHDSHV